MLLLTTDFSIERSGIDTIIIREKRWTPCKHLPLTSSHSTYNLASVDSLERLDRLGGAAAAGRCRLDDLTWGVCDDINAYDTTESREYPQRPMAKGERHL